MLNRIQSALAQFWREDAYRRWILVGGFVYAWFFSQGIPLWDDDFTSWFRQTSQHGFLYYIWNVISPISTQPQYWGFNERPIQALLYKVCYLISGYDSWSYFLVKSAVYGGLGAMIYQWGRRLAPESENGRIAAALGAVFFLLAPGPMAAHVLHQDLAPVAELFFLSITYVLWREVERTPAHWSGMPRLSDPEQKSWMIRWSALAVLTYLGYKSKADLKLIPMILAAYVMVVRRQQWRHFAAPIALMLLLAVPWGPGIFSKLPPFIPGSGGSQVGWMYQEAKLQRVFDFIWNSGQKFDPAYHFKAATISLAGLLGPYLLIGMIAFFGWRMEALDKVPWFTQETTRDRSRTFVLIWFAAILAATSSLPEINYIFRIRYGILPMVPTAILLAWVFGMYVESVARIPKWATSVAMLLLAVQCASNLTRSVVYRREMGQVMVAVDQAYRHVNDKLPNEKLVLLPDFRPYDQWPDASKSLSEKTWLNNTDELARNYKPFSTYVISWKPSLWEQLEIVENFSGCRATSLFDRIFPCPAGTGVALMRYIGPDPLYTLGEQARQKRDFATARAFHEKYLAKYPNSMAGHFVLGLESFEQKDWNRADQAYSALEKYFPDHLSILYNRALALVELKNYDGAIDRLRFIASREPKNYAALINLYWAYVKNGQDRRAKEVLTAMQRVFPEDGEVKRLLASTS